MLVQVPLPAPFLPDVPELSLDLDPLLARSAQAAPARGSAPGPAPVSAPVPAPAPGPAAAPVPAPAPAATPRRAAAGSTNSQPSAVSDPRRTGGAPLPVWLATTAEGVLPLVGLPCCPLGQLGLLQALFGRLHWYQLCAKEMPGAQNRRVTLQS